MSGGDTEAIPRNDAGRLFAFSFAVIAAGKLIEKVVSHFNSKPKRQVLPKQGIIWRGSEGQKYAQLLASGPEVSQSEEAKEPKESIWQVTRVMEKRAMKEAHERQYAHCKMTFSSTVSKPQPREEDSFDITEENDTQTATASVAAPQPARFPGMPGMGMPGMPGMGF